MSDGSSQAATEMREVEERARLAKKIEAPSTRPSVAMLPRTAASSFPETRKVDEIDEFDRRVVQTAVRRAVSKAIRHIAARDPDEATERDVQLENSIVEFLIKEMLASVDYSGGLKEKVT